MKGRNNRTVILTLWMHSFSTFILILEINWCGWNWFEINIIFFIFVFVELSTKQLVGLIHVKLRKSSFLRSSFVLLMLKLLIFDYIFWLFNWSSLGKIMISYSHLEVFQSFISINSFVNVWFHKALGVHFIFISMDAFLILVFFNEWFKSVLFINVIHNLSWIHESIILIIDGSQVPRKDTHCKGRSNHDVWSLDEAWKVQLLCHFFIIDVSRCHEWLFGGEKEIFVCWFWFVRNFTRIFFDLVTNFLLVRIPISSDWTIV